MGAGESGVKCTHHIATLNGPLMFVMGIKPTPHCDEIAITQTRTFFAKDKTMHKIDSSSLYTILNHAPGYCGAQDTGLVTKTRVPFHQSTVCRVWHSL